LTGREADVLACLADGLSNNAIAEKLFLSPSTVKWYVRQLNSKLDTSNRDEIVIRARAIGLLTADKPEFVPAKHNLPYQTTPFIGRDVELDELARILATPDVRLLTFLLPVAWAKHASPSKPPSSRFTTSSMVCSSFPCNRCWGLTKSFLGGAASRFPVHGG